MASSVFPYHAGVYLRVARFLGTKQRPDPLDVEQVLTDANHLIDRQEKTIKHLMFVTQQQETELELMWSELRWLVSVLKEADIVLSDYDYMRLQQVTIKARVAGVQ